MPKTRIEKEEILSKISDRLTRSVSVVFVNVQGVKVDEVESIRNALFAGGLQLQVAKNSLLKRALEDAKIEVPSDMLDQPLGVVYSYDDAIASAKLMAPFDKEIEALQIVGGIMDGAFIPAADVIALSKLPSREQLLGQLVGTLAAPLSGMVNVMAGNLRGLVTVLAQIQEAKA